MSAPELDARLAGAVPPDGVVTTLRAWRATRLPWLRYLPLALLIGWAASIAAPMQPGVIALSVVLAFGLIAQLRLWDDLEDRERDRHRHPDRVLVRCADVRAIGVACALGGAACLLALLVWRGPHVATGYGALCLGLGAWYRLQRARGAVHAHVLLLKYPAISVLLAAPAVPGWALACAAAGIYAAMCAFELVDRAAALPRAVRLALGIHALVSGAAALGLRVDAPGLAAAVLSALAIMAGGGALGAVPGRRYLPFLALVVVLVRHSIGVSA